jgi:hypothetical protein
MSDAAGAMVPEVATGDGAGTWESTTDGAEAMPNNPAVGLCRGQISAGTAPIGNKSS